MHIGVPKEIKQDENRVGMTPESVRELAARGHTVSVESGAGAQIGLSDAMYREAGAQLAGGAEEVFAEADLIVKVKEPQATERARLREGQAIFTYLHLAPDAEQTHELLACGCTAIAYETVTDKDGGLPLLAPMSAVAGRMAIQAGAHSLEMHAGGRGVLLSGLSDVAPGKILILGGGVVGRNAAHIATGIGADVTVLSRSAATLEQVDRETGGRAKTVTSSNQAIETLAREADLVVGAVLVPGGAAPKLITRKILATMNRGSVIVDVAIDQGGCCETSRPTTHSDPTYVVDGVVHYCVANMPGAVARTSTYALNAATLPFVEALADKGWRQAMRDDPHLRAGLNVHEGHITHPAVAEALGLDLQPSEAVIAA